jgi:hypothetical protein
MQNILPSLSLHFYSSCPGPSNLSCILGHQGNLTESQDLNKKFGLFREVFFSQVKTHKSKFRDKVGESTDYFQGKTKWLGSVLTTSSFLASTGLYFGHLHVSFIFCHADAGRPFVEMHSEIPKLIHLTEGQELVIPCRVTSPNITVTLKKVKLSNTSLRDFSLQMSRMKFYRFVSLE